MAPTGIITLNSISGYNNEQEELTSMSGEQKTGKIDVSAKSKIATQTITIINYLLENRNLSKTQYRIVLAIIKRINNKQSTRYEIVDNCPSIFLNENVKNITMVGTHLIVEVEKAKVFLNIRTHP